MVVDTSALLAILQDDPERRSFNEALEAADAWWISVVTLVEASILVESRYGAEGLHDLDLVPLDAVDVVDIRRWPRSWACPPRTTTATPRSRGRCRAEAAPPCDDLPQPAADRHARSLRHVVAAGRRTMDSRNKPGY